MREALMVERDRLDNWLRDHRKEDNEVLYASVSNLRRHVEALILGRGSKSGILLALRHTEVEIGKSRKFAA